jgi:predicted lipoprotein with Yx(FWY)xxD motif
MRPARRRLCVRLVLGLAAIGSAVIPTVAIAGLPNAVIGTGKIAGYNVTALVNVRGRTIYISMAERNGRSHCYGDCLANWTPVLTSSKVFARRASGVNQELLGTTRRTNGKLQVTYNHHPLYTSTSDYGPGDSSGQGCTDPSGHAWWIINNQGNPVKSFINCQAY